MRYIIGQLNIKYILKRLQIESLALNSDFAGSRPVVVTYFFHANYLFKSILPTIGVHFGSFFLI